MGITDGDVVASGAAVCIKSNPHFCPNEIGHKCGKSMKLLGIQHEVVMVGEDKWKLQRVISINLAVEPEKLECGAISFLAEYVDAAGAVCPHEFDHRQCEDGVSKSARPNDEGRFGVDTGRFPLPS